MREHLAVTRHTLREAPGHDGGRSAANRPSGRRFLLLVALACVGVLALGAGSAQALLVHTASFGSQGMGAGQFNSPEGVAVDQSNGDVYVVDTGNLRVQKFSPTGQFILAFGTGVDATTGGNVCTGASGDTCGPGTAGGMFNDPLFVAVDNSSGASAGDVYVGDPGDQTISKFNSDGTVATSWPAGTGGGQLPGTAGAGGFSSIDGITVDNGGNLLVINDSNPVFEFTQDGSPITNFSTGSRGMSALGMDVDSSGNIFKVNGDGSVEELTSTGGDTGQVSSGSSSTGLVIDRSSGTLYQDVGNGINEYDFNASGAVTEPSGPACAVAQNTGCPPSQSYGANVTTAGTGMGFDSANSLLYVADAGSSSVAIFGPPSPGAPVVETNSEVATNVGNASATLNATVNPFGVDTTCTFQYVDDTDFQATGFTGSNVQTVPCSPADLGTTFSDQAASANISGLTLNTTYDFRVIAVNGDGTTDGPAAQFATLGPAVVEFEGAPTVGSTTAQLSASVNPLGQDTTCDVQYVDDADFASGGFSNANTVTVPCSPNDVGSGSTDVSVVANISGLTPNTLYDFRFQATNSNGTENGATTQFTSSPDVVIEPGSESASNIGSQSATLNATVNPEGTDTTCEFQYVDDADFQSSGFTGSSVVTVPCSPADLGSGIGDVAATADITGLTASTTYDFRVVAINSLTGADGVAGDAAQFTTTPPVSIDAEAVNNVTSTGATLTAQVNPNGLDTHVQFQFVTDTQFQSSAYTDATTVPTTPIDIGNGLSDQPVSVNLTGLTPSTKYHFRAVGTNTAGTANGQDQTFTTFAATTATGLPDGRAYEQVTPVNKDDGEPGNRNGLGGSGVAIDGQFLTSTSGDAFGYTSFDAFQGSKSDGGFYEALRGSSSWVSTNLIPPQSTEGSLLCATLGGQIPFYTPDMSKQVLEDGAALIPPCGTDAPPLQTAHPEPQGVQNLFVHDNATNSYQMVNVTPSNAMATAANATFDGASSDLSTVVFDESNQLTSNAPAGADNLYEWNASSPNAPTLVSVVNGTGDPGSIAGGTMGQALGAVSTDGKNIFFVDGTNGNLYDRQAGSANAVQVDAAASGAAGPGGGGQFLGATADGSNVFFMDDASNGLTSNTTPNSGANLYEFNTSSKTLTDLTPSSTLGSDAIAQVQGLAGMDSTGAFVYFVAEGALKTSSSAQGQGSPASAQPNLYLLHNGSLTFIATLSGSDGNDWTASSLTSRVSGNGQFLAFTSTAELTNFDNNGDPEIFLYDSGVANRISCASCMPDGAPPTAGATIDTPAFSTPLLNSGTGYLQHNVSNTGQVFFDTPDALVPTDTNGQPDVYEFENGQVHLLSSGTSPDASLFADATPNGSDAFFMTSSQLVPQDTDTAMDIYDARVGGGFPASAPAPICQGEGCRPAAASAPPAPVVATVTFSGPGNVKSTSGGSSTKNKKKHKKHKKSKKASVSVLTTQATGSRIKIRVNVPGRGRISVAGRNLRGSSRGVRHAGTYALTARLKPQAMSALAFKHKVKLTIRVRYVPAGGSNASTATVKLTVKA